MSRNSAIFLNGGAGRMLNSIPALENYQKENPEDDFVIVSPKENNSEKWLIKVTFKCAQLNQNNTCKI